MLQVLGIYFTWTLVDPLDDCSNFGFTALLRARTEAVPFYKNTEAFLERKTSRRVLTVRMDGARELSEGDLAGHFRTAGIAVQVTAPYAHLQNGKAERYVRTLEDGSQVLLADSGLPASFWGDAVLTVQYVRNHVPTSTLPLDKTPYDVFFGTKPDLSHLRVWGCQCFAFIPPELRSKGGNRRFEAIFVGYEEGRVGWRVRDLQGRFHFSRDVIFNEASTGRRLCLARAVPAPLPAECPSRPSHQHILDLFTWGVFSSVVVLTLLPALPCLPLTVSSLSQTLSLSLPYSPVLLTLVLSRWCVWSLTL
jgi:hypothetical protein